eukprot:CAMPEP_0206494472 /NCGR_PEP_ID=MMETSP0324_2-20121206/47746_1 /ASSEMBLY_ACC=CAM_ASM_000836 /TAXON_ID=2866 /ORGANISM="Crypthecodinium cohnii, Strain Seligo" /LENGTH=480 /DNA_ID=CAMNT_0053978129 /DNA_START=104 /DNA_END=1543 /DNA_ORIENTATION=+
MSRDDASYQGQLNLTTGATTCRSSTCSNSRSGAAALAAASKPSRNNSSTNNNTNSNSKKPPLWARPRRCFSLRKLPQLASFVLVVVAICSSIPHAVSAEANTKAKARPPPSFPLPPEVRPDGCGKEVEDPNGDNFDDLKVSIIIPYRNERLDHIKGSLESILYYTPKRYLSEILFVSDGNPIEQIYLKELRSMSKLVSFLVIPSPGAGLIEAKMRAVAGAALNSTVLVFLEPHIRTNRQWLQPLLRRIRLYPKVLAMPMLDPIPQDNFNQYLRGTSGQWRFEWNLNLIFSEPVPRTPSATPYMSPATSGGIFAIRRDWWNELGLYDHGMIGWGGDHIEATLKVWRCGGHIEVVPCSHVGHLFRDPDHRPYPVVVEQVVRNYARIAEVWLEEYLPYFYKVKPEANGMEVGDLSAAFKLKEKLQCKSMKWYLENVDREMEWEKDHICIPGCDIPKICCKGPQHPQRTTLDKIMPVELYKSRP